MVDRNTEYADKVIDSLGRSQDFSSAIVALQCVDVGAISDSKRSQLLSAIASSATKRGGPIFMLSLPARFQVELALSSSVNVPGVDRTVYKKATPSQVVRFLTSRSPNRSMLDNIVLHYDFSAFKKGDWLEYLSTCLEPISAARTFLLKEENVGGFSDDEITCLVLKKPSLAKCLPVTRIGPNTAVALLISGKVPTLWQTYDFQRLGKKHWRELFLHTNPYKLPEACRPFIENKNGGGFSNGELVEMARNCHALINFLDPEKVPFNVAYELYQTGKADLLWKNFPFATLDKAEWRRILTNPDIRIPNAFREVVRSGRFKPDELCELALKNDQLLPFLLVAAFPPDCIVDLLLRSSCAYLWENYDFDRLSPPQWERLILGVSYVIRRRALVSFGRCSGMNEAQVSKIVRKNHAYSSWAPPALITPTLAIEVLSADNKSRLWESYDFSRLSNDQWLELLARMGVVVPVVVQEFLRNRTSSVDNDKLNAVLARRKDFARYVPPSLIKPEVALPIIVSDPHNQLWELYDFARFEKGLLKVLVKNTNRNGHWPTSLRKRFEKISSPFDFDDMLEIEAANVVLAVELVSYEIVNEIDDERFGRFVAEASKSNKGKAALASRLRSDNGSWRNLSLPKLKMLLVHAPSLRKYVDWKSWPYQHISELAKEQPVFESEMPHRNIFFIWKHWKSLLSMVAITVVMVGLLVVQHVESVRKDADRARWNAIVARILQLDRSGSVEELKVYLDSLPQADKVVVSKDLLVVNATRKLAEHERQQKENGVAIDELQRMVTAGLRGNDQQKVLRLLQRLDSGMADRGPRKTEYLEVREKCVGFLREQERKKKVDELRSALKDIQAESQNAASIGDLEDLLKKLEPARSYSELGDLTKSVEVAISGRMAELKKAILLKDVETVSNVVEQVATAMKDVGAYATLSQLKSRLKGLSGQAGFPEYMLRGQARYEAVNSSLNAFQELMEEAGGKESLADSLDKKYSRDFMTAEGMTECSNLVAFCDSAISRATSGQLADAVKAYKSIRGKAVQISARDLRARRLVEKVNTAGSYAEYLNSRDELIRNFGEYAQLKSFVELPLITLSDANKTHTIPTDNYLLPKRVRYHYVGVICLTPGEYGKVRVAVDKTKLAHYALLLALDKDARNAIRPRTLIEMMNEGRYYLMKSVRNYDLYQGVPLFVTDDEYVERR